MTDANNKTTIRAAVNLTDRGGWIQVKLFRCKDFDGHSDYFETRAVKTGEPLTWGETKQEALDDIAITVRQAIEFDADGDLLRLVEFN